MAVKIGYLLPTRESVMEGRPAAAPLPRCARFPPGILFAT